MSAEPAAERIALDTSIFIYYLEDHSFYAPLVEPLFTAAGEGRIELLTSALTLLELTAFPLRQGEEALARSYEEILRGGEGLSLMAVDLDVLRAAARLRALRRLRTPDAIHLASAIVAGADRFLTNDQRLPCEIAGLVVDKLPRASEEVHEGAPVGFDVL